MEKTGVDLVDMVFVALISILTAMSFVISFVCLSALWLSLRAGTDGPQEAINATACVASFVFCLSLLVMRLSR